MTALRRLVIIVEDSSDCAETLQIALEAVAGVEVLVCLNERGVWPMLEQHAARIAAVITDLHLVSSDGFKLIRRLRSDERFARVPVLLVSGDSDPSTGSIALASGADAYFSKPYSPSAVRKKLEELLC